MTNDHTVDLYLAAALAATRADETAAWNAGDAPAFAFALALRLDLLRCVGLYTSWEYFA